MAVSNFKVKTVSKKELLQWFRENISPNLASFEELGNGVDFCLGVDMVFPGVIGNRIIELTETTEYSKRLNFRRLQTAFNSLNVKTDIPIDGLIKGSFKDMFAFGIWFKAFFETNCKSQPKELDKIRASHLKKWVKRKRQYETHKSKLYLKDGKRQGSSGNQHNLQNKGDCDSVDNCSENNVVFNSNTSEDDDQTLNMFLETPTELLSTEESDDINVTETYTPDQSLDISTEAVYGENNSLDDLKSNTASLETTSCDLLNNTTGSDADHQTYVVESEDATAASIPDSNCLTHTITEGSLAKDMNPSSLNDPLIEKLIPSVMISEQINIELENYNIHLKESLERLSKKYDVLCRAVNEVKETLNEISINPISDEPTEDQFCTIKMCCQRITKVLNDEDEEEETDLVTSEECTDENGFTSVNNNLEIDEG